MTNSNGENKLRDKLWEGQSNANLVSSEQNVNLRVEYKRTGWTSMSDAGSATFAATWDNAFNTLLGVVCAVEKASDTGEPAYVELIASSSTGATARVERGGTSGNAVNTRVNFWAWGT